MTLSLAIERFNNLTVTDNGAVAHSSTMDACLDLFGGLAACRKDIPAALELFRAAYSEDAETALRILFYTRDIRGGQGERAIFRAVSNDLAQSDSTVVERLLPLVSEYGRWDDLLSLDGTPVWDSVLTLIRTQLSADVQELEAGRPVSLLAKWLPSANASSRTSVRLARAIAAHLGLTESEYRKQLVALRKQLRIIEHAMCSGDWSAIEYSHVPSKAMNMYRRAFSRHDCERFGAFLQDVKDGKTKINAGTLYPYDLVAPYLNGGECDDTLNLQWEALPNYMEGKEFNGLVVADVSGSMKGLPMAVSISLAMYIAERNTCETFRNKFLTFSAEPQLCEITGDNLSERVTNLSRADWDMNTDLTKVFTLVLESAKRFNVSASDMPSKLIIVSDMQFDEATSDRYGEVTPTNFEYIKQMYVDAGYQAPHLVFWNVNGAHNVPFTVHESGATLVSGCSPAVLRSVLNGELITAVDVMRDAVYCDRYDAVGAALSV